MKTKKINISVSEPINFRYHEPLDTINTSLNHYNTNNFSLFTILNTNESHIKHLPN